MQRHRRHTLQNTLAFSYKALLTLSMCKTVRPLTASISFRWVQWLSNVWWTKDDSYPSVMRWIRIFLFYALKKLNPHPTVIHSKGLGGDASPPLSVLSLNLVFQTDKGWSRVLKKLWKCMCWDSNGSPTGNRTNCLRRKEERCVLPSQTKKCPVLLCLLTLDLWTPCSSPSSFDGIYLLSSAAKCRRLLLWHH